MQPETVFYQNVNSEQSDSLLYVITLGRSKTKRERINDEYIDVLCALYTAKIYHRHNSRNTSLIENNNTDKSENVYENILANDWRYDCEMRKCTNPKLADEQIKYRLKII